MANSSIDLINLDFDTLKAGFVNYLKSQEQFKDYNFDSSNINVLMDLLSYNTYKNTFYLNMIFAESFIDSAQLKESLYSHAKELNYLPRSSKSAVANVTISFSASGEAQPYIIRKGETFSTIIKQDAYTFSTFEDVILTSSNNNFISTFNIYEGIYVTDSYIFDGSTQFQQFKISNENVDTDSLSVLVYEDGSTIPQKYTKATTLLDLNENSKVFFIQGSTDGKYEILFGDGILGKRPKGGSTIVLDYRISSGDLANGARTFSANFDPTGAGELLSPITVTLNKYTNETDGAYSVNGAEPETLDSIRYYAPRHFQTQERAVTFSDYEIILKSKFPEIGAVSVYGGEDANPPRYGKVFISIDIKNVEGLPDTKKNEYYNFIKSRSPLSIDPIFINPEFTYVSVDSIIRFNINITTRTAQNIKADAVLTISEFADTYLNDFKSTLRYSKLVKEIDNIDDSVVSNQTELTIYKKILPKLGVPQNIDINFGIPLAETYYILDKFTTVESRHNLENVHIVHSSLFTYNGDKCEIEDNGDGILRIIKKTGSFHTVVGNIGTVDYITGAIKLNNFKPDSFDGNYFKMYAKTKDKDISSLRNEILSIESDEINVKVEAIRE